MASRTSPLGWTAEARDLRTREDDAVPRLAVPLLAVLALLAPTSAAIGTSGTSGTSGTTIPSTGTSCVSEPLRSGYAFIGTVASTSADGRDVRAADSSTPQPNTATSVDRSSATGTRYEFHPLTPASTDEDDPCTATHEVAAAPAAPPEPPATTVSTGAFVTALVALGVVAVVGTAAAFLIPNRRRRNRRRRRRA